MKLTALGAVLVTALIVGGAAAYFLTLGPTGTLAVGVTDAPVPSNVSHLYLTITDITLQNDAGASYVYKVNATTFDLLHLANLTKFLGASQVPTGNYTMLRFNVTSAVATVAGANVTVNVPSAEMKVAFSSQKLEVRQGASVTLVLDINPMMTNISSSLNLRPEVTIKSILYNEATSA